MLWYSEVILADIMVTEKQSDMERRNGSPCIITSQSFLFFPLTTLKCLSESHEEVWGKQLMVMAEGKRKRGKKKNKEKKLRLLGYLSRKRNACGWYVASKGPSVTSFKLIQSCWGRKK